MPTTMTAQDGARLTRQTTLTVTGCATGVRARGGGSLCRLKVSPSRFAAAAKGATIARPPKRGRGRRVKPSGATVSYVDVQASTTTFLVLAHVPGERHGKSCVAATERKRGRRKARPCGTAYRKLGSFTHRDVAGANSFHFTGRLLGRKLAPGSYRLQAGSAIAAFAIRQG